MQCSRCENKAVYETTGQAYCKDHFFDYFETKVFRTIKKYGLIKRDDRVCVATSGGKDSLAVLYMTMLYCKKHDIDFFALAIDEGIKDYRDHTLDDLRSFCERYDIPMTVVSFKARFGSTLDEVADTAIKDHNKKPCTVCGILRRSLLNKGARELEATKLVTGHNLDDEAQSFFMNTLKGSMAHNASLGPMTGLSENSDFVPRVKPLYFISEKETRLFAFLKGFKVEFNECPNIGLSFRAKVRDELNAIESAVPGSKNGMVNAFLQILPDLKEKYRKQRKAFSYCTRCGEPCSGDICNVCKLEDELCLEVSDSSMLKH
ncbi:MAG: TIGR00269 family protein [Nanoarchaeota archaeon]